MTTTAYRTPAGYRAYLKTPYWREKRIHILRRAAVGHRIPMCEVCGCHAPAIEVHHHIYDRMPWYEHDDDLIAVCRHHHETLHQRRGRERNAYRRGGRIAADSCGTVRRMERPTQMTLPLRR
jgi:hypothetical protein